MPATLALATEHHRAGRLQEAEAACRALLSREPRSSDTFHLLGRVLQALGRPLDAGGMYRRAVELEPRHAGAHLDLGFVSLLLGDYANGWAEYEWRLHVAEAAAPPVPRWDGTEPAGRTILIQCEPDVGDCIQFARYLPLLTGRGADVVLRCPPELVRLFGSLPDVCVITDGDPPPRADAWLPIGSLPLVFRTTPATIPTFGAYLRADARLVAAWRQRLRPLREGGQRLVGLAWPHASASGRLLRLAEAAGVRLVALPNHPPRARPPYGHAELDAPDLFEHLHDFAEAAALITQLDLVITANSPGAHLAGALGKPCWTLLAATSTWQWGVSGDDSAWYPSVRLFRQETAGDWLPVLNDVGQSLKHTFGLKHSGLAA